MKRAIQTIKTFAVLSLAVLPSVATAQEQPSPVEIFEQTWQTFNTNYPYFDHHGIDWDAIYRVYRPQVSEQTTDAELFDVLCHMLGHLNDGHINFSNGDMTFNTGVIYGKKMTDYSEQLVRTKYLGNRFEAKQDSNLIYGWLADDIGYLRIRRWKQKHRVGAIVDSILAELKTARGLVVDVRANTGGNAFAAEAIADRFADRKRLYAKNYPKRGPGHDSLFPPRYAYIEPAGPVQFTGPVVVLQHLFSESATEEFIMAMRVLSHATTIGDITSGCFGNYYPDELANGWTIGMPWSYETDQDDRCWVGIGLPPNLRVLNSEEDIAQGKDRVLEFAIALIESGGHSCKEIPGSLSDMRSSLVELFLEIAPTSGIDGAVAECRRVLREQPDKFYFSAQECMNAAQALFEDNEPERLKALMDLASETWPDAITFNWVLGLIYKQQGIVDSATTAYRRIADRDAFFPWEKSYVDDARRFLEGK
jgi:carboxyl-terminal processing protease